MPLCHWSVIITVSRSPEWNLETCCISSWLWNFFQQVTSVCLSNFGGPPLRFLPFYPTQPQPPNPYPGPPLPSPRWSSQQIHVALSNESARKEVHRISLLLFSPHLQEEHRSALLQSILKRVRSLGCLDFSEFTLLFVLIWFLWP